jgi:hypothetical protein
MLRLPLGLLLAVAVLQTSPSESAADERGPATAFAEELQSNLNLVSEIAAMGARAQYGRRLLQRRWEPDGFSGSELDHYHEMIWAEITRIDDANEARLKEILRSTSWRHLAELGRETYEAAWLVAQHSPDVEFQAQALSEIEPLAREGMVRGSSYALLYDRVSLARGNNQLYGSQLGCIDGEWAVEPIDDPEHLAERRAQFGLGPMSEYVARVIEHSPGCPTSSE